MRESLGLCLFSLAVVAGCGSDGPSVSTCVPGSTQACPCPGGSSGVQSCQPDGTYASCQCGAADGGSGTDAGPDVDQDAGSRPDGSSSGDGGPVVDAGSGDCPGALTECDGRCIDTSTDEANCGGCGSDHACADGSFCVDGVCQDVGACPTPFVVCDGDCIDPRSNADYCGASGDCSGDSAGMECGGACLDSRCVYESCAAVLSAGASTGDGTYLIDIDGTGAIPPQDVYCDMTVAGGGWMLIYKIRNDVPDISDPWWGMVDLGSGEMLPTAPTPLPSGTHFEGPTRDVRQAHFRTLGTPEYRGTAISPSGDVVVDVRNVNRTLDPLGRIASGSMGTPSGCSGFASYNETVISAQASTGLSAGSMAEECYFMSSGGSGDVVQLRDGTNVAAILGDSSISGYASGALASSTTLIWIRPLTP